MSAEKAVDQGNGNEPQFTSDPRVLFAAERTLLAWIRTGLAMMGFGFVVARFGVFLREIASIQHAHSHSPRLSLWIGAALVVVGVLVNLLAARAHVRLIKRLKRGETYNPSPWSLGVGVTLVLAAVGLVMMAYLIREGL
jgi:putative membrane protein